MLKGERIVGHLVNAKEEVYRALAERLNRNPVGAPVNEYLMEILHRLYTVTEAEVGASFPLLPVPIEKIAEATGMKKSELKETLEKMADKGLVLDLPRRDGTYYMLAPMIVGFFEYTFMRVRDGVNMKELAELFEKYFQSDGVREEIFGGDTKMFQALVYESLIPAVVETEVLSYERASEIIRQSGGGALGMCSCRHKAAHLGTACDAPVDDVCVSLGNAGRWLVHRGMAKPASVDDLLRVLDRTEKLGLVHLGDNVLNKPAYICHCCGCCCGVLRAINESGIRAVHPSNFLPKVEEDNCVGCGTCTESCHINAISLAEKKGARIAVVDEGLCIGCGVCASACPTGALGMSRRSKLHVPPADKREQFARIAREKGRF
ncbi:4Fe-4S ferredoxin iron-sulfur binding domain-containing protein [Desulfofundulus kuznetsovii DSM 6115]|uniref:Ferredoxin n=1 Tax=Desulfofundulus kuznetsovii (strain DSM 6115 / VKM B-1805 / 17) TaxID=760568 RepID=A0AAU8PV91_DESK7|nr:4Fe-4S ferredoxin iron-sulfur binding domain-containing protein [Desulfofundulus kuznetsovii DSM 6115]